jgi:hypothetical protein
MAKSRQTDPHPLLPILKLPALSSIFGGICLQSCRVFDKKFNSNIESLVLWARLELIGYFLDNGVGMSEIRTPFHSTAKGKLLPSGVKSKPGPWTRILYFRLHKSTANARNLRPQ